MSELARLAVLGAFAALALGAALAVADVGQRRFRPAWLAAGVGGSFALPAIVSVGRSATILAVNAFAFLSLAVAVRLVTRGLGGDHLTLLFDLFVTMAWAAAGLHLYGRVRPEASLISLVALPVALGLLGYVTLAAGTHAVSAYCPIG